MNLRYLTLITIGMLLFGANNPASAQPSGLLSSARQFLGTPYVGGTLEVNDKEALVVNQEEVDCSTLVEYSLAHSICAQLGDTSSSAFRHHLQQIRYRQGIISGYTSRLHYATDWIYNGEQAGYFRNITKEIGGTRLPLQLHYMSSHPQHYRHLDGNPREIAAIRAIEDSINARTHYYIAKENIPAVSAKIQDGDIIFFVTSIAGLDVSHMGIACRKGKTLTFVHASTRAKQVIVNPESLVAYCMNNKRTKGIIVCRPREISILNK